jgi:excisionase family DNA binding protein
MSKGKPVEMKSVETIDALAARLGVSHWTIRAWLREGRVPFIRVGRRILVRVEDLEAFLEANYQPAARPSARRA